MVPIIFTQSEASEAAYTVTALLQVFYWRAVSFVALCREDPFWPEGRRIALERFEGRVPY